MNSLNGKSIAITGASSGLGEALALELAAEGARLTLLARDQSRLDDVARRCREKRASVLVVTGDVTHPEDSRRLIGATVAAYGSLDVFVANAGISMWSRCDEVEDLEVFRRLIEVNYLGAVWGICAALPELKRARGLVVAISSIQGRIAVPQHAGYVASKHALQGFCETLRLEQEVNGVGVLTVLPHWMRGTNLRQHALGGAGRELGTASRKHSRDAVSVEEAARSILDAMRERRRELYLPWKLRLLYGLNAVRPELAESLVRSAVSRQQE